MCGLLAMLTTDGNGARFVDAVESGLPCMRHRGPDAAGTWHDDKAVFGFNRLSIIDLAHSHQPLRWGPEENPERYAMTFNGEIYNYIELRAQLQSLGGYEFRTSGDSETIVVGFHHWGEKVVEHLRGMFAFVIWDTETDTMFVARDQFGIKPLYYATTAAGTVFASEKKSILEMAEAIGLDLTLDRRAIQHYVDLQYTPEPESLHESIRRVESGCTVTLKPGGEVVSQRYFNPTFEVRPVPRGSEQDLFDRIAEVLDDSVAKHMRADVTVGSFLSGGIDSTAIAALAKKYNPDLLTFTTGFEREGYSEIDVAAESAEAIGAEHIVKVVSPEEYAAAIPKIMWYLDDPVADPSLVPLYFVAETARQHVKVVLSGEGADELFGGYTIYKEPLSLAPFERIPDPMLKGLRKLGQMLPDGMKGKSLLDRGTQPMEDRYYGNARNFSYEQLQRVLPWAKPEWDHREVTAPIYKVSKELGMDPVARMQHLDLFTWMRGDILVKADKINMANSLELRVPFLDKEVFEVAQTIPHELKIAEGTTKYALRKALEQIVPPHVLHRKKLGFPVPMRHWLAGDELFGWAQDTITESQTEDIFNKKEVLEMLKEHRDGVSDHSRRLWTVLCFMVWHGIFVEKRINPDIEERDYPVKL